MAARRKLRTRAQKQGRRARRKGSNYEREVADALRALFPQAMRGIGQARASGEVPDVQGTPFWIECKHRRALNVTAALEQARMELMRYEASGGTKKYLCPLLVARLDRGAPGSTRTDLAVLRLDDFLALLRRSHDDGATATTRADAPTASARPTDLGEPAGCGPADCATCPDTTCAGHPGRAVHRS